MKAKINDEGHSYIGLLPNQIAEVIEILPNGKAIIEVLYADGRPHDDKRNGLRFPPGTYEIVEDV